MLHARRFLERNGSSKRKLGEVVDRQEEVAVASGCVGVSLRQVKLDLTSRVIQTSRVPHAEPACTDRTISKGRSVLM
jgi:hypothetical protein